MRHGFSGRRLNRTSSHRKAMLRAMACALIQYEKINTTLPKAKELRPFVEKLVTMCRVDNINTRRRAVAILQRKDIVNKIFDVISKRFANRNGGYIRIMRNGFRYGDDAPMAVIEFVERDMASGTVERSQDKSASL